MAQFAKTVIFSLYLYPSMRHQAQCAADCLCTTLGIVFALGMAYVMLSASEAARRPPDWEITVEGDTLMWNGMNITFEDPYERELELLRNAVARLIEEHMRWAPNSSDRPEGADTHCKLIKAFTKQMDDNERERQERRERAMREYEESDRLWREARYKQMSDACKNNEKWLSTKGREECCAHATNSSHVTCNLDTGTPGKYYSWDVVSVKFDIFSKQSL